MAEPARRCFEIVSDRSAVLLAARSNVGPVAFGTTEVTGSIALVTNGTEIDATAAPCARIEIATESLTSGNALYDAELARRIDARRFPLTVVELLHAERADSERFMVRGAVTFHGVTRELAGTVAVSFAAPDTLVVTGEHALDIRDFDLSAPTMLMLKIFPDVRVQLQLEARPAQ